MFSGAIASLSSGFGIRGTSQIHWCLLGHIEIVRRHGYKARDNGTMFRLWEDKGVGLASVEHVVEGASTFERWTNLMLTLGELLLGKSLYILPISACNTLVTPV
jgi:hypothetical protein